MGPGYDDYDYAMAMAQESAAYDVSNTAYEANWQNPDPPDDSGGGFTDNPPIEGYYAQHPFRKAATRLTSEWATAPSSKSVPCLRCGQEFPSRNRLFRDHLPHCDTAATPAANQ
jgi:hypothetical protein